MKKLYIIVIILVVLASFAYSDNAVVKSFTGKVEVKLTSNSSWVPVTVNMQIPAGATISTGFNSSAVLDLGASTIQVKSLTRMKIEDLIASQETISTSLFLQFGKVTADVELNEDIEHDFMLKSPISTAAVRGTSFDFDTISVTVNDGSVVFYNQLNQHRTVNPGGSSKTSGTDLPAEVREMLEQASSVSSVTSALADIPDVLLPGAYVLYLNQLIQDLLPE